jgi:hypothetical protein
MVGYPWAAGGSLYAADLNNKITLTLMSGTYYVPFTANVTHTNSSPYDTLRPATGSETVLTYTGSGMITLLVHDFYVIGGFIVPTWKVTIDGTVRWSGAGVQVYRNAIDHWITDIMNTPFRFFSGIKVEEYGDGSVYSPGGGATVIYVKEGI